MVIKNGNVVTGDFSVKKLNVSVNNGIISGFVSNDDEVFDATGMYVLPGFIDTHIHGAYGTRVSDFEPDFEAFLGYEASQGVTAITATTGTSEFNNILRQFSMIVKATQKRIPGARLEGIHAEGPFICKKYKGAMTEQNIIVPTAEYCEKLYEASQGLLKIITIAPDTEGSDEAIEYFASRNVVVSMGHTNATFQEAQHAVSIGASQSTHTFNAMRPYNHREPGVLGCALTNQNVKCEMICDFVHLHPTTVKLIYQSKGADKINIISDSGHAAGIEKSEFEVDGIKRYVKDGVIRLADGTIAGSAVSLLAGVRNLWKLGIPISDISRMASLNPAKTLGIDKRTGSIEVGKQADITVLDSDFNVVLTLVGGEAVYRKS